MWCGKYPFTPRVKRIIYPVRPYCPNISTKLTWYLGHWSPGPWCQQAIPRYCTEFVKRMHLDCQYRWRIPITHVISMASNGHAKYSLRFLSMTQRERVLNKARNPHYKPSELHNGSNRRLYIILPENENILWAVILVTIYTMGRVLSFICGDILVFCRDESRISST